MSARVAAHIALHAKRPVAPLEGAFECYTARVECQITEAMTAIWQNSIDTYDVRPCGCEHESRTSKSYFYSFY